MANGVHEFFHTSFVGPFFLLPCYLHFIICFYHVFTWCYVVIIFNFSSSFSTSLIDSKYFWVKHHYSDLWEIPCSLPKLLWYVQMHSLSSASWVLSFVSAGFPRGASQKGDREGKLGLELACLKTVFTLSKGCLTFLFSVWVSCFASKLLLIKLYTIFSWHAFLNF